MRESGTSPSDERRPLSDGSRVGAYLIEKTLGTGGFGISYVAKDTCLQRRIVLKEYFPRGIACRAPDSSVALTTAELGSQYRSGMNRFLSEGRLLARIQHSNVARVLTCFEAKKTCYIAIAYEPGETLESGLRRGRYRDETSLCNIALGLLDALGAVHEAGIIHRDVNPSNILIARDGRPVLLEFGSATGLHGNESDASVSTISPGYSPLELYHPERYAQGPWTDLYGVAATVYRAIAGVALRYPLISGDDLKAGGREAVPACVAGATRYSEAFLCAIDHALERYPESRPRRVDQWRQELDAVSSDQQAAHSSPTGHESSLQHLKDYTVCRDEVLDGLLARVRRCLDSKTASNSERESAFACCQRVLAADPTNADARAYMKRLAFKLVAEARAAIRHQSSQRAADMLALAELALPNDDNIMHMRSQLRSSAHAWTSHQDVRPSGEQCAA